MGEECGEEELFWTTHTKDLQNQTLFEEKGVPEKAQLDCVSSRNFELQLKQVQITRESTTTTSSSSFPVSTCDGGTVGFLSTGETWIVWGDGGGFSLGVHVHVSVVTHIRLVMYEYLRS